jgi:co-chaperonin GroES (HSP10)
MLRLPRGKIAAVPIFDSADTGIKGYGDSNIILLDKYRERVDQGIVKYVGDGVTVERFGFNIGDHIIFSGYTGELVNIEGDGLFILLPARFVVATIRTEPTQIPGLFFQEANGDFFPATYEAAMPLMAKAIEESEWRQINIKKFTPKLDEYDTHIEELVDDE